MSRQIVPVAPPLNERRLRAVASADKPMHRGRRGPYRLPARIIGLLRKIRAIGGFAMLIEVFASALGCSNQVKLALAAMTAGVAAVLLKVLHTP